MSEFYSNIDGDKKAPPCRMIQGDTKRRRKHEWENTDYSHPLQFKICTICGRTKSIAVYTGRVWYHKGKRITTKKGKNGVTLKYNSGDDSPPTVIVKENGEITITWNFVYDHHDNSYYAIGERPHNTDKIKYLSADKEAAIGLYNRVIAHINTECNKEVVKSG